jgi:CRISPR-associated endonuclease/helicase Cas3
MIRERESYVGKMSVEYAFFFSAAYGGAHPFAFQEKLAYALQSNPGHSVPNCRINVPTGMGKTAAVVLAWLWNQLGDEAASLWPRRLVYCLPMRSLVEQTQADVALRLANLSAAQRNGKLGLGERAAKLLAELAERGPIVLMGGVESSADSRDWDLSPEAPAIIIGTQDMLLSRALNRGYAMNSHRWPMHFALLNNDCLWVMDEVQLMGVGVETGTQLQGLREKIGGAGCATWWMSATLDAGRLATVDFRDSLKMVKRVELEPEDRAIQTVAERLNAAKALHAAAGMRLTPKDETGYAKALAEKVCAAYAEKPGLTLVIVNRVSRAQEVFKNVKALLGTNRADECLLLHSRFRPNERDAFMKRLAGEPPFAGVVIATQVVEAGLDLSATTLFTELCPWSSFVQRAGRCNRRGKVEGARIFWIDFEKTDDKAAVELALPYDADRIAECRSLLVGMGEGSDAGPASLTAITARPETKVRPVLRRKDLLDLFDTTPDLSGADIDVSRYVRDADAESADVFLFWRELPRGVKADDLNAKEIMQPVRAELCRVGIGRFKEFLKKLGKTHAKPAESLNAWTWDALDGEWRAVRDDNSIIPGRMYLLPRLAGGYEDALGWTGQVGEEKKNKKSGAVERLNMPEWIRPTDDTGIPFGREHNAGEEYASGGARDAQELFDHTRAVLVETSRVMATLSVSDAERAALRTAAIWHDAGKAHPVFQLAVRGYNKDEGGKTLEPDAVYEIAAASLSGQPLLAKSGKDEEGRSKMARYCRKQFRHELASALGWLGSDAAKDLDPQTRALVAYLIAAHHGKVRLSLRSMPGEAVPANTAAGEALFARGIWQNDTLPAVGQLPMELPDGRDGRLVVARPISLDLSPMRMGSGSYNRPSWLEMTLELRNRIGPFRLALLETLLRAADARASKEADTPENKEAAV